MKPEPMKPEPMKPQPMKRGIAMPIVIGIILLVVPVVLALSVRSAGTLNLHIKQESQKRALALAEQALESAREALATNSTVFEASRSVPNGGMLYKTLFWSRGELTQPVYLCAAEGVYLGEERMVVALVEVLPGNTADPSVPTPVGQPPALVLEHDRQWIYSERGGTPLVPQQVKDDYMARLDGFFALLKTESQLSSSSFVTQLTTQINQLDCNDVSTYNAQIVQQLGPAQFQ